MARPGRTRALLARWGLTPKVLLLTGLVLAVVVTALTWSAARELERGLTSAFRSKGEAIAVAIAAAAERSAKGDPLLLQNSIEANRHLQGVSYIFVREA